jgi:hypothetical protein
VHRGHYVGARGARSQAAVAGTLPRPPTLDNDSITFGGLLAEALTANFVNAHIPFSTTPVVPMEDRPVSIRQPGSGRRVPAPPRSRRPTAVAMPVIGPCRPLDSVLRQALENGMKQHAMSCTPLFFGLNRDA